MNPAGHSPPTANVGLPRNLAVPYVVPQPRHNHCHRRNLRYGTGGTLAPALTGPGSSAHADAILSEELAATAHLAVGGEDVPLFAKVFAVDASGPPALRSTVVPASDRT